MAPARPRCSGRLPGCCAPRPAQCRSTAAPSPIGRRRSCARALAYLPQERTVHWALSARAVVALGRLPHQPMGAGESAADAHAIDAALAAMDVDHLRTGPCSRCRAASAPACWLRVRWRRSRACCWPTSRPPASIPRTSSTLFRHLTALAAAGRTVVVALHDLSLAARFCHRIVLMQAGRSGGGGRARGCADARAPCRRLRHRGALCAGRRRAGCAAARGAAMIGP